MNLHSGEGLYRVHLQFVFDDDCMLGRMLFFAGDTSWLILQCLRPLGVQQRSQSQS